MAKKRNADGRPHMFLYEANMKLLVINNKEYDYEESQW